ncbi:MAG: RHS repeat-associated core domain-containing protein, partial [Vulcanimicrobiaceae bacterium]
VRNYDPQLGSWTTPDAYAGTVEDPMSQQSYMYNNNNPISFSDPSGYCSDPGGRGVRICIDAFIQQRTVMIFYSGDNRTFNGRMKVDRYRVRANVNMTTRTGNVVVGYSHVDGKAKKATGGGTVTFSGNTAHVEMNGKAGGFLNGVAPAVQASLTLTMNINGTISVSGTHTQFPSFEIFVYGGIQNGAIYKYDENPRWPIGPFFLNRGKDITVKPR